VSTLENDAPNLSGVRFAQPSPDPFRPQDLNFPQAITTAPPCCPVCLAMLHPINQNGAGDLLFECLADHQVGYTAVFRAASGEWEQRPGVVMTRWAPPLTHAEAAERRARRGVV
jgi:hypothetical protein